MKVDSEIIKFHFDENYKDVIESSSIVRDFDKFIGMADDGLLELSKNNILSMSSVILVNETILKKISLQLKRPLIKSFPNVLSLFILFNLSGLRDIEIKGKKKFLRVNTQMLEQWRQFSDVEKYFSLFSLTFTNFTFNSINERGGGFEFDLVMKMIIENKGELKVNKGNEYYFNGYPFKTILITLNMLGLIDLKEAPQIENQGWNIKSIQSKNFMSDKWDTISKLRTYCLLSGFDNDEKYSENYKFTIEDINEIVINKTLSDKITEQIPEFSKRLKMNIENRPGIYYFKVHLGKVWRTFKVDYRNSLNDLCYSILKSFDFYLDHLYDVTFMSSFGYNLTFNGAPEISYAEYPTTKNILIGDLPINVNHEMNFTFDYGANWEFLILLERIETLKKEVHEIPEIKITKVKGEAPKQYGSWG